MNDPRIKRLQAAIPQLIEDMRSLRDEYTASRRHAGRPAPNPLTSTANDLAIAVMDAGGLPLTIPPQRSGCDPDPARLAADWERYVASLAPRVAKDAPIMVDAPGWRY